MKFKHGTRRRAIEYEKDLVKKWKENKTFEKSVEGRPENNSFVFYDGPPFLTGTPHHGHLLVSTVKDSVARYKTMQGFRVERTWGWDCHGLPAEVFVENKLGIKNKKEIGTKISIADYVKECRAAMVKTGTEWEDAIERIGRWVEFKGAYKTMDNEYMESVWWAFKKLYDDGKIYEGEKILIYCTKDATPISKSEVAMENSYQMDTDPSVYVYFELENSDEMLLAWTTTPWTLPANVAVAVNPALDYALVEYNHKKFYIAEAAAEKVLKDEKNQALEYKILKKVSGKSLIGRSYHPLFQNHGPVAHRVLAADFVNAEDGTGIVHEAPAYGEEDYELCKAEGIPIVSIVDENGHYTEGRWQGEYIWDINKTIAKTLVEEEKALKVEYIRHEYPHCHRCGSKLMYRAHPSWFMDIQGQKDQMLEANESTKWVPEHLRTGRFKHIIETAPDWNLSRDRYWATPIPVWKGTRNDGTEVIKVIGSYEEFEKLSGKTLDDYHLPKVMDVEFEYDGTTMRHTHKVLDCWFESGSMPFAQFHYPFENKEKFESSYPADFITEAIDQTRGWFYSLTAVNVGLFDTSPFKNLICTGFINAADGKKMSKKLNNYTDPLDLMDKYSADSFRMLMLLSPLSNGENFSLSDKDVGDVARKLSMVWNVYDFFTMYAEVDGWVFDGEIKDPSDKLTNVLDIWIVSKLHTLINEVHENMNNYDLQSSTKPILPFVDDLSNWYVRRSRRRFWKTEDDSDKNDAYTTLHYVLTKLSLTLAPFTPFLAEELYINLTNRNSVHLENWPKSGAINNKVLNDMDFTREVINLGLSERSKSQLKVRQPLSKVVVIGATKAVENINKMYVDIIEEELNVKAVEFDKTGSKIEVKIDKNLTDSLILEGLSREVIRYIQAARKDAGLQVDDRINLNLDTSSELLNQAIAKFITDIKSETLASSVSYETKKLDFSINVKLGEAELTIAIQKA